MKKILQTAALLGLLTLVLLTTASCEEILSKLPFISIDEGTTPKVTTPAAIPETTTPEQTPPSHTHIFGTWTITKSATCTQKGEQERTCTCGEKEIQAIDALGHTEVIDAAVVPTCTTDGKTEGSHCSACGEIFTAQEVIPATHDWMQTALLESATCFTYGEEHRSCRVCGVEEDAPVEPLKHNFVLNEETQLHTCTLCNGILFAGHLYAAFEGEYHWFDAYELCEEMGGHLVTITSEYEQAVIDNLMNSELRTVQVYAIGAIRTSNTIGWITGEPMEYQNWEGNQPNFDNQNQHFVNTYSHLTGSAYVGKWNDYDHQLKSAFICEWELSITDCEHKFTEWTPLIEVSCWNDGEQYRICTYCGAEETEILSQLEHNFISSNEAEFEMCEYCKAAKYNGHIYALLTDTCYWFDAYSRCESLGGHLITITSEEEQSFISSLLETVQHSSPTWIGGYTDGEIWRWVTGETFEYTHWTKGNPDNADGNEWFAYLYNKQFEWNDYPPTRNFAYICEFECEE